MYKTVPIHQLLTDRFLVPGDDLTALAKHINDSGLQVPILVRDDMFIIDGLRRMEAMRELGLTTIDVFIPSTFMEGVEYLRRTLANTTEALPLKARRMYEIKRDLVPITWAERGRVNRGIPRSALPRPVTSVTGRQSVVLLAQVFGVTKSYLSTTSRLFGLEATLPASIDPKEFQRALEDMNEGHVRPGTIVAMLDQSKLFKGPIRGANDQREAIRSATAAVTGVLGGLTALGPLNKAIRSDELLELRSALQRLRRANNKIINAVSEEMRKR